jgi:hypothetical protein
VCVADASSLALLVSLFRANHSNGTITTNNFAISTDFLNGCSYFHVGPNNLSFLTRDAERRHRHSHAERGNERIFSRSHALRGNACLDALRRISALKD